MANYKHSQLKNKSFEEIRMLFDNTIKWVDSFVPMNTEVVEGSKSRAEESKKRTREGLESDNSKKQKIDENVEAEVDDEAEMKKLMEIVPDEEVAIDDIPLATKSPIIVDWKIIKEGNMGYFQIIRVDRSSRRYGYQEMDKRKHKTGQSRAREWNEREKTSPTVLSNLIGPARFDQYQPPQFSVINHPPQETSKEILQAQEDLMEAIHAFLKEYDHIPPNEKCMALLLAEERFLKIKQAMEEERNQPEVLQELLFKLINDLQNLKGILSKQEKKKPTAQSSIPYWNSSMIDDEEARDNFLKDVYTFLKKFSHITFGVTPKVILIAWESFSEIKDALMDKQYRQEDIQELMSKLLEDVQNINEEFSEYINCPSWNRPLFYFDNDDDEFTVIWRRPKAITPNEPIEEPDNSLSMGDEHLDTIPVTESDEVINSSIKILVPIPSELKGISDDTCDVPICDDSSTFDALNDNSEILSNSNNDDTSSDDDDFEDVEYVTLEEVNDDHDEKEFDLEDILQIQDVILREKLLNVHRLITNIESLNNNPTPDFVLESPSSFPISVIEPDQEGLISIDNSNDPLLELPEFESFHFDPSFPRPPPKPSDVEICLHFEPDVPVIDNFNELNDDQRGSEIDFSQNVEDDDSFTFIIQTFLPFLIYPEVSLLSCSTGSEDTIFDPGIST
ncbi:hypothetical protein Tco_0374205 [Tanacetum coccineum]